MDPTWQQMFGEAEPVQGDHVQFQRAADHFGDFRVRADEVADSIRRFQQGSSMQAFQGAAADAFRAKLQDVDEGFQDVPYVVGRVEQCFQKHATDLKALQGRFDEALARAQVKWRALQRSEDQEEQSVAAVSSLRQQVRYLESMATPDDPDSMNRVQIEESRLRAAESTASATRIETGRLRTDLEEIGDLQKGFAADEHEIEQSTVERLAGIDLRGLQDPTNLFEHFVDFIESVPDLVAFAGEVALEALLALREILEFVGKALTVVTLVVFAIVAVVFLVKGAIVLGAVLTGLGIAAVLIAGSALLVEFALFKLGARDPSTGEKVGVGDLVEKGIGLAMAALGAGAGRIAGALSKQGWVDDVARSKATLEMASTAYDVIDLVYEPINDSAVDLARTGRPSPLLVTVATLWPAVSIPFISSTVLRTKVTDAGFKLPTPKWGDAAKSCEARLASVGGGW